MNTEIISTNHPDAIPRAVSVLDQGGIVAFPTDTVYGLAAAVFDSSAIELLFQVKERDHGKAIAVLMSSPKDLDRVAINSNQAAVKLAEHFWPGPLTLVVPRHPALPEILSPLPTIGVRVPDHPDALALMDATGPLAVTSANLSGKDNACTAAEVLDQLEGRVHLILDGGSTPGGQPSTVVDCTSSELSILRAGPISWEAIQSALHGNKTSHNAQS
ncbi:MAG: threonylcarbamoyl-AMP synthase [Anaerolineales bacterium]|nr:threonylcarbamoyl-AMP synthase [Anaerolineales bacterium]